MQKKVVNYIGIITILVLLCMILISRCENNRLTKKLSEYKGPDTVYIKKPYKVEIIKEVEKPYKVEVYRVDTVLRNTVENQDLILKVQYKRNFLFKDLDYLKVDKITKQGFITSNTYRVGDAKQITVVNDGKAEIKQRKIKPKHVLIGGAIIGVATAATVKLLKK